MDIREAIRKHSMLGPGTPVGVVSSFCVKAEVRTGNGDRDIAVIANTRDIDLDDEVVLPGGANPEYFRRNGQVFANHDYTIPAVAHLRKMYLYPSPEKPEGWRVIMRAYTTSLGNDLLTIAREGGIGSSIGFVPTDHGPPTDLEVKSLSRGGEPPRSVVRKWDWHELSLTCRPCNVACQGAAAVQSDDTKAAYLDGLVTKGAIRRESAAAFGMPDRVVRGRIVVPVVVDLDGLIR